MREGWVRKENGDCMYVVGGHVHVREREDGNSGQIVSIIAVIVTACFVNK